MLVKLVREIVGRLQLSSLARAEPCVLQEHDFPMAAVPMLLLGVNPVAGEIGTGQVLLCSSRQVKTTIIAVEMNPFSTERAWIHYAFCLPHETA